MKASGRQWRIGQGVDFRRPAASRATDGLSFLPLWMLRPLTPAAVYSPGAAGAPCPPSGTGVALGFNVEGEVRARVGAASVRVDLSQTGNARRDLLLILNFRLTAWSASDSFPTGGFAQRAKVDQFRGSAFRTAWSQAEHVRLPAGRLPRLLPLSRISRSWFLRSTSERAKVRTQDQRLPHRRGGD